MPTDLAEAAGRIRRPLRVTAPFIVCVLMIAASVSWRQKVLFTGGLDPVVVIKGLLSVTALAVAWRLRRRCSTPRPMGTRYVWLLITYLTVTLFGAWANEDLFATLVLAVRVGILAATVVLLVRTFAAEVVVRSLLGAMITIGAVGAVTGVATIASGRLEGGIPPLSPNEIALLFGIPAVGLMWLVLTGRATAKHGVLIALLLGAVWLTGSRTTLMAVFVAIAVMLPQVRRMQPIVAVSVGFVAAGIAFLALATSAVGDYFERGGDSNITTLSSRTIAWSAAVDFPQNMWTQYMGAGIATKRIPVKGEYWDFQLLDSSWVSALVQVGYIGVLILGVWCLTAVVASLRCQREARMFLLSVLVLLIIRSTLESGLLDSTPSFIMFMTACLLVDKTTRAGLLAADRPIIDRSRTQRRNLVAETSVTGVSTARRARSSHQYEHRHNSEATR